MNFPSRKEIGRDIMPAPQGWEEKLCLLLRVQNHPIIEECRHKNHPPSPFIRLMIFVGWFMINFVSCFTIGEAYGWGKFPKCGARLCLSPQPRPLILRMLPPQRITPLAQFQTWLFIHSSRPPVLGSFFKKNSQVSLVPNWI